MNLHNIPKERTFVITEDMKKAICHLRYLRYDIFVLRPRENSPERARLDVGMSTNNPRRLISNANVGIAFWAAYNAPTTDFDMLDVRIEYE